MRRRSSMLRNAKQGGIVAAEIQRKKRRFVTIAIALLFVMLTCFLWIYPKWYGKPKLLMAVSANMLLGALMTFLAVGVMAAWRFISMAGLNRKLLREIADRRRAEEENVRKTLMLDNAPNAITVHDFEGRFLYANQMSFELHGYSRDEFMSLTLRELDTPSDRELLAPRMRELRDRGEATFQIEHVRKDGTILPLELYARVVSWGDTKAILSIATDITERRKVNDALMESEGRYHVLFEGSADGILIADIETKRFKYANPAVCRMFGSSEGELRTMGVADIHPKAELAHIVAEFEAQARGDKIIASDIPCVRKDGTIFFADISTVKNMIDGRACNVGFFRDVTERKGVADAMRKSEKRLNEAQKIAHTGDWEWNLATNAVHWSDELYRIYGFEPGSIAPDYALVLARMHPESKDEFLRAIDAALKEDRPFEMDYRFFRKDGVEAALHTIGQVIRDASGAPVRMLGIVQDITERKKAEDLIHCSLQEKEVLLKEIHHRVKNNMQVIHSLLNLQAKSIPDKSVRVLFEDARNRVNSMALIHEKLYRSKDLAHVDFREYLQSLIAGIADTYKRQDVVLSLDMEPVPLDVNVGIPCGLIVNELVSNSFKHAFPEGKGGAIRVGLNNNGKGYHVLIVQDNGAGFPANLDFRNTSSLGLQLVNVLTRQIHGMIELSLNEGTRYCITFPAASDAKKPIHTWHA